MTNAKGLQLAHGRLSREDGARREPEVAREALGRREDAAARADERVRRQVLATSMTRVLLGREKRGRVLPVVLPVFRPIMRFSR